MDFQGATISSDTGFLFINPVVLMAIRTWGGQEN
jgi:hypothetical protein